MGTVSDYAGTLGALPDGRLDKHRITGDFVWRAIRGGEIRSTAEKPVGPGFRAADPDSLTSRGDDLRMKGVALLGKAQQSAVVSRIDIVNAIGIDHPIQRRDECGIIDKGKAGHTGLKNELRMTGDTCGTEETDKF